MAACWSGRSQTARARRRPCMPTTCRRPAWRPCRRCSRLSSAAARQPEGQAWGLTSTITATNPTFLQGAVSEYSGIATTASLDQVAVGSGTSAAAASGATGSVAVGELLFSGLMTGSSPGGVTANGGLVVRAQNASFSVDDADMKVATAGAQNATWTLLNSVDWYDVAAVFHAAP